MWQVRGYGMLSVMPWCWVLFAVTPLNSLLLMCLRKLEYFTCYWNVLPGPYCQKCWYYLTLYSLLLMYDFSPLCVHRQVFKCMHQLGYIPLFCKLFSWKVHKSWETPSSHCIASCMYVQCNYLSSGNTMEACILLLLIYIIWYMFVH